jgi:hypothetical protein
MPSPDAWSGRRQESGTHPLARAAVRWRTLSRRRRLSPTPCQTRATGGSAVELANPERDEQAVLDGLLAMISDLGGVEVAPPPEVEADRLLAQLAALTG